jgi:hypothetical protein
LVSFSRLIFLGGFRVISVQPGSFSEAVALWCTRTLTTVTFTAAKSEGASVSDTPRIPGCEPDELLLPHPESKTINNTITPRLIYALCLCILASSCLPKTALIAKSVVLLSSNPVLQQSFPSLFLLFNHHFFRRIHIRRINQEKVTGFKDIRNRFEGDFLSGVKPAKVEALFRRSLPYPQCGPETREEGDTFPPKEKCNTIGFNRY